MKKLALFILIIIVFESEQISAQETIPYLQKAGDSYHLMVHKQPFRILAGELGNSTATTSESMEMVWLRLKELNLNTVLIPVYWELVEPQEGKFDFELVDSLLLQARQHNLKIVFLWFGAWKNSMSSHVPSWVKLDQNRFPRAKDENGISQEILTPFSENNLNADISAYTKLLQHIKELDEKEQTVILMQPENEIGMLPSARDFHALANEKFNAEVPEKLINYLKENKNNLVPEFYQVWEENGFKTKGNWETIFGKGLHTDELFMAYYYALYTNKVSAAGKSAYNLPVYVNAALNRPGKMPGEYPSAGPLPHLIDVWKAASPAIDFYAPDFYNPRFKHWNDLYIRQGNPLFVPEHRFDNTVSAKALYAFGHYQSLGFSPFSIEQIPESAFTAKEEKLATVYDALNQVKHLLDAQWGKNKIEGVLLDKEVSKVVFQLGDYEFMASHTYNLGWEPNAQSEEWEPAGALLIQTDEKEFYYIGFGVSLKMKSLKDDKLQVGILKTERGYFNNGNWVVYQHLNGDQTHQGRHIRSFINDLCIQRFTLYEYE